MHAFALFFTMKIMFITSVIELGALVRSERRKRNWTQQELAERVGVKSLWVSQFERGKATAQVGLVLRTLKTLDIVLQVGNVCSDKEQVDSMDIDLDSIVGL